MSEVTLVLVVLLHWRKKLYACVFNFYLTVLSVAYTALGQIIGQWINNVLKISRKDTVLFWTEAPIAMYLVTPLLVADVGPEN
jgi:hypothetical protein